MADLSEEPRYGRRVSPSQEGAHASAHSSTYEGNDGAGSTPWPQYGEVNPQGPLPVPQFQGGPTGVPVGHQLYAAPAYSGPSLPSRAPSVWIVVLGLFVMFLVAPLVFLGSLMVNGSLMEKVSTVRTLNNGDMVSVDASGSYFVAASRPDVYSCTMTGQDGVAHPMETTSLMAGFQIYDLEAGSYALTCEGEGSFTLEGMSFYSQENILDFGTRAFVWASIVGLCGIIVTVVGVVKLLHVNRRRNSIRAGLRL
ncbi:MULTISPECIES: hypothetical protein [unclassified Schaalia]|uniref:hypothetical protein n=1 Tax=unclassified Schaalia TaxID=2691889 RepID=UPI001E4800B2|nr:MULTISPECIES: hypothetical protein [unclassified Schaalia]MCD4549946.1 hypothetical protein [Schaalia sp. lx-260]MCD4557696.1 hypothetical protein [Schaalia sp. lx-100]